MSNTGTWATAAMVFTSQHCDSPDTLIQVDFMQAMINSRVGVVRKIYIREAACYTYYTVKSLQASFFFVRISYRHNP